MCSNCIITKRDSCTFRGWRKSCDRCETAKRAKCTFQMRDEDRQDQQDLLAAALRGNQTGECLPRL